MGQRDDDLDIRSFNHSYFSNNLTFISNGHKPPNLHKWGPGVRDIYALHYIISGKEVLETRHGIFQLKEGESFIIFTQIEIYYYPDEQDPWEYVWVEFSGDEVEHPLSQTMLAPDKPVVPACQESLMAFFDIEENTHINPFNKIRSDAKLRLLLSYYMEYYQKEMINSQTNYVEVAKSYIHNNYWKSNMRVSNIVNAVKIERSYL